MGVLQHGWSVADGEGVTRRPLGSTTPPAAGGAASSALGSRASVVFIAISTPSFVVLLIAAVLVGPEAVRPGLAPGLAALVVLILVVAGLAVLQHHRTGRPAGWWASWIIAVISASTLSLADPSLRQIMALSLMAAPLYAAMFETARAALVKLVVVAVVSALLGAHGGGSRELLLLRSVCTTSLVVTLVAGLLVLRARLDAALADAAHLARHDPLTGLLNRRGLAERFPELVARGRRSGSALGVVLADIDHFKAVNDVHGHGAGDAVLVGAGAALLAGAHPGDLVVRLGGEELLVVALVEGPTDLQVLAERVRVVIAGAPVVPSVTASVGAVGARVDGDPEHALSQMLARADDLMYRAKAAGRDRSVVDPELSTTGASRHP